MENFEKIEDKVQNMSDYNITEKRKNPIYGILLTVIGAAIAALGASKLIMIDALEMATISIGSILAIYGFTKTIFTFQKDSKYYVYQPTNKRMKSHKIYINSSDRIKVSNFIEANDFSKINQLKKELSTGNMLHFLGTDDGEVFLLQVNEYIPHAFVPASPVVVLQNESAKKVLEFINYKS